MLIFKRHEWGVFIALLCEGTLLLMHSLLVYLSMAFEYHLIIGQRIVCFESNRSLAQ